jgi:hypothetical protein
MSIVNTDFNSNSYSISNGPGASGSIIEFSRIKNGFADKAAEAVSSEVNSAAAKSNVSNADLASEVVYFSRLQAISGAGNYIPGRAKNPAVTIFNTAGPRFDRSF